MAALDGITPHDAWYKKLCICHLRVFGFTAYIHVQREYGIPNPENASCWDIDRYSKAIEYLIMSCRMCCSRNVIFGYSF